MTLTIRAVQNESDHSVSISTSNDNKKSDASVKSIFTGNLGQKFNKNSGTKGIMEQKRQSAQQQAMKLISDAWGRDEKAAQRIADMRQQKVDKLSEMKEAKSYLKDIEKKITALQEEYGVDSDSQEQKDLELLEKFQNYKNGSEFSDFSKEEINRLNELQYMPRTEYQNKVLQLNGQAGEFKKKASMAENKVASLTGSITNAELDQLKSRDMLNAGNAADAIMDAASEEIFGLLIKEGKDNIEDKMEEEQEKAEKVEEKREEQQERIEDAKEGKEYQEELIKGDTKADQLELDASLEQQNTRNVEETQKHIQKILKENNLVNEDLKGIKIDFNF